MRYWQRCDQCLAQFKRAMNYMRLRLQIIWNWIAGVERKLKHPLQITHCFGRCINRHGASRVRKAAEIVKAHYMIGVRMRENDCIYAANVFSERLCSKIGSRIHHPGTFRRFDIDHERSRWSRGSGDWQTSQSQPIMGTPCDVPVPRKVTTS